MRRYQGERKSFRKGGSSRFLKCNGWARLDLYPQRGSYPRSTTMDKVPLPLFLFFSFLFLLFFYRRYRRFPCDDARTNVVISGLQESPARSVRGRESRCAIERDATDSDTREDPISITRKRTNIPDERVTFRESSRECSTTVTLSVTQKCNKYLKNVEKTLKNKDVPWNVRVDISYAYASCGS